MLYGDKAYWSEDVREMCDATGIRCRVQRRAARGTPLSTHWEAVNRSRSRVQARGDHGFQVVKRLWGFVKVRYRGLAKNTARAFAAFALANLYLLRYPLLPAGAECRL